jgi:hypothetical protein
MRLGWILALAAVFVCATASVLRADPELRSLFPLQAALYSNSDQLSRLELSSELMSTCRVDLADLRVFDRKGREVPFLIDSALGPDQHLEVQQTFVPQFLKAVQQTVGQTVEQTVGQAEEKRPPLLRETYELTTPTVVSQTGVWDLVVETAELHFVRRIRVVVHTSDGAETEVLAEDSLFRLQDPLREKVRITLPPVVAKSVEVILEGEEKIFLEPTFRFENSRPLPSRDRVVVELEELSRQHADGKTLIELARPRGLQPDLLRFSPSTGTFNRRVEVWDEGPGAVDQILARQTLFRVRAVTTVEELEIPLHTAYGDRLRVVIHDGDSPPLNDLLVRAVVRRPVLLFSLPKVDAEFEGAAGTLRFGGGRAYRPKYDLESLLPSFDHPVTGTEAEVVERLYDPALLGTIRLGSVEANPHFDPTPVLAFAHRPGSVIKAELYEFRRQLAVEPSTEGLARVQLTPEDLSRVRPNLEDLRIVDGDSRQWAFLLEQGSAYEERELVLADATSEDGTSTYPLLLPVESVRLNQVVLETSTPFFDRAFELVGEREKREIILAAGRLARRIGDPRPVEISFNEQRVDALELRIEDGDDASLSFHRITVRFPVPELYFAAPAGNYSLLMGNPEGRAPRYELARVRDVVLAVESADVALGGLEENPTYSARARLATDGGAQQALLWIALALAVVVLTVLTLRLARREDG